MCHRPYWGPAIDELPPLQLCSFCQCTLVSGLDEGVEVVVDGIKAMLCTPCHGEWEAGTIGFIPTPRPEPEEAA